MVAEMHGEADDERATHLGPQAPPEGLLRMVVEAAPNAIVLVDARRRIALVNAQTEKLFGYWREEMLGQPIELLVPDAFRANHPERMATFFTQPGPRLLGNNRDVYGRRRDGTEVPIEVGLNPIETPAGMYVLASIIDVSERKRAEARLRLLVEAAPSGMLMIDQRGRIQLANTQAVRLFGYPADVLVGMEIEALVPERFRSGHAAHRAGFVRAPQTRAMGAGRDLHCVRADGIEVPIEIGLNPIETADGPAVLASVIDVSERKRAEAQLTAALTALEARNEELQSFAVVASHDLQEPLRKVQAFGKRLRDRLSVDGPPPDELERILRASERMQRLIEGLLAYSRVSLVPMDPVPTPLDGVVRAALSDLEARIETSGAQVRVSPLPAVRGDPLQMHQLFLNLLSNALKFRHPEREPRIVVDCSVAEDSPGVARIRVLDNGVGFDVRQADLAFAPFQRLHRREEFEGTGMGLAIVHKIVDRHGGEIHVESTPGAGACFTVALPLA